MLRVCSLKICIAIEIIGKKTHTALKGHKFGGKGKIIYFALIKSIACLAQKAFCIRLKIIKHKLNLIIIIVVLGAGVSTKANRIAEIIKRKTRHNRVKVDNANSIIAVAVKKNVIKFCIIMGYTKWEFTFFNKFNKLFAILTPVHNKLNFFTAINSSVRLISLNCRDKFIFISPNCIMEILNNFAETFSRKIT